MTRGTNGTSFRRRTLDTGQRHPVGEAEPRRRTHDDVAVDLKVFYQDVEHARRHPGVDLQQRQLTVPDLAQALVDRLQQVDRLFLLQDDVGFADDAEEMCVGDVHAGEELCPRLMRMTSSRNANTPRPTGQVRRDRDEPGKHVRHLDAREPGRAVPLTTTAKLLLLLEMYGNGWPGSNASGVSTGHTR